MEDSGPFTDQSLLFSTGRLESLCAVELILFLEKEFDLSTGDPAFDVNLLDSVDEIVSLIEVR
jgi:acyl carrier protein